MQFVTLNYKHNKGVTMEQRALVRSKNNKMIAGVLGGFADRYGWDATWLRLLFIISFLLPGPQAIFYFVAWIIMPEGE